MENTFLLRIEIIIFLISLGYFSYYTLYNVKKIFIKKERQVKDKKGNIIQKSINGELSEGINTIIKETKFITEDENHLNMDDKMKINELVRRASIFVEKGDLEKSKNLVVEGLALDKNNKQLNLSLADIYNKESEYKKSEYIYRELIEKQKEDFDLLKKLGFVLALQKKYKDSIRVYKEALEKKPNDNGIIDILSDLTYEVEDFEGSIKFAKLTLRDKPRDSEKLQLIAYSYDHLLDTKNALYYYHKIVELQPYNTKIIDRIKELEYGVKPNNEEQNTEY